MTMVAITLRASYHIRMQDHNEQKTPSNERTSLRLSRPGSTLVLGGVLLVCLFLAQLIVMSRSVRVRQQQKARLNTAELIETVFNNGLDSYLGRANILRYFLLEKDGRISGYSIFLLEPQIQPDKQLVFLGKELFYEWDKNQKTPPYLQQADFIIANDLSWYQYRSTYPVIYKGKSLGIIQEQHQVQEGILSGSFFDGQRKALIEPKKITKNNLIPPALLDFFSSLAAEQQPDKEMVFAFTRQS